MTGVREQPSAAEQQATRTRLYRNGSRGACRAVERLAARRADPGSEQAWGFWMSSIAIRVLSVGLSASFKRRDWI